MAVASALRIARNFNRDGATPALPLEGLFILAHDSSFARVQGESQLRGYSEQVVASGHPKPSDARYCAGDVAGERRGRAAQPRRLEPARPDDVVGVVSLR